jgi:hypothetical protein
MKGEEKKSFFSVPWDNMPRQPDPANDRSRTRQPRAVPRENGDPTFSTAQAFCPFSATKVNFEEEK